MTTRRRPVPRGAIWRGATLAVLVALMAGGLAQLRVDTGLGSLLPTGDRTYAALEDKARSFGGDPVVVLLRSELPRDLFLDGGQLAGLLQLEGELAGLPEVAAVYGPATILNQIAGAAQDVLARISGSRDAVQDGVRERVLQEGGDEAAAQDAVDAALAAFDARYASLLVEGLPAGLPTLRNERFVDQVLFDTDAPRRQWRAVIPSERAAAILVRPQEGLDQRASAELTHGVQAALRDSGVDAEAIVTGVPVVTSAMTLRAQRELPLLGLVAIAAVAAVFLLSGGRGRRRWQRMRPLVATVLGTGLTLAAFGWLGISASLGIVAFLPILIGIGSDFPLHLSQTVERRRVLVAASAVVAAYASLALSPLPFVRQLGIALAIGVAATVAIALLFARWYPPHPSSSYPATVPGRRPSSTGLPVPVLRGLVVLGLVGGLVGWAVLPSLEIETRPEQLARGLDELADVAAVERELGSSAEVSLVLNGPDVLAPDVLRWSRAAQDAVTGVAAGRADPLLSAADLLAFLGEDATEEQTASALELLPRYLSNAVVRSDRTAGLTVFGVTFAGVEEQQQLLRDMAEAVPAAPDGHSWELVGLPVVAARGLELVAAGRAQVNLSGLLAAALVLLVALRSRRDTSRALATVALATGWVLLFAAVTRGALNPLTVAIGSLTTATAIEFSILLSDAHRRSLPWLRRSVQTAAAAGTVAYLSLAVSGLAVLRDLALLLTAGVVASYFAAELVRRLTGPAPEIPSDRRSHASPTAEIVGSS